MAPSTKVLAQWPFALSCATALIIGLCPANQTGAGDQQQQILAAIHEAWLSRANRVRSFRLSWTVENTVTKGLYLDPGEAARKNPRQKTVPPEDVDPERDCAIVRHIEDLNGTPRAHYTIHEYELSGDTWFPRR